MIKMIKRNPCLICDFYDSDYGCCCPSDEMWYACLLTPEPTPEDFEARGIEYQEWGTERV